jgi:hypothetical protein
MVQILNTIILPESVIQAAGVRGRQKRSNIRTINQGGFVDITVVWDTTLRDFEIGYIPMALEHWHTIEGLFEATDGGAYGFLMSDPKDQTTGGQGVMFPQATAGQFRLGKRYTSVGSLVTRDRYINRPKAGLIIRRNGTPVSAGIAPGQIAINMDTGRVTFVADATRTVTAVTVGSTTQITLATALPSMAIGGRVFLTGFAGADAALLNNLYHSITNIAGTVYTLSTNTAGKVITAGAPALAAKYPQPAESLSWEGGFYVPVQFAEDALGWEMPRPGPYDGRIVSGQSLMLLEVREA